MSALELNNENSISLSVVELPPHEDDDSVSVLVDSEWYVASGGEALAALLDMDVADIHHAPIGVFIHPEDITYSPLELGRTGGDLILRFLHRTDGYVRVRVSVMRSRYLPDCWNLRLRPAEADVLELSRGGTGFGSNARQGESRSTEGLSVV